MPKHQHPAESGTPHQRLSHSEKQLLEGLSAGRTNIQLGQQFHRSEKTVRNRLTRLYAKLGARNRAEAVAIYLRGLAGGVPESTERIRRDEDRDIRPIDSRTSG